MRNKLIIFLCFSLNIYLPGMGFQLIKTIENDEFYKLREVAVSQNGIYILDVGNKTVFHYSTDFNHIQTISNAGQGPGEFIEPNDIIVEKDTLWILGHTLMKVGKFVDGKLFDSFQMERMPFSFTKVKKQFIVSQVFSSSFLSSYSVGGQLIDLTKAQGVAKKKLFGSSFNLFSALTHLSSSKDNIYLTYEYKNAIEKYDMNMEFVKSKNISEKIKEPIVKKGNNNSWYIDGNAIAKDIEYFQKKVYVLWMSQKEQVECEGLSQLSVFTENLKFIETVTIPDCVVGIDIYDNKLYGVCNEPYPMVVIYEIE